MPKKRIKVSQKGVSDLVSNIFIITLVIIIAIILFSWGYNYYKEMQEQKELEMQKELACSDIYFAAKEVCYTSNRIEITLENKATDSIIELVYRLKKDAEVFDWGIAPRELGVYSVKKYKIGYVDPMKNRAPDSIELFPVIALGDMSVTCDNLLRVERIKVCSGYTVEAGVVYTCGNGKIDIGEDCDGSNLNDYSCSDFGNYDSGALYCKDCSVVLTGCKKSSSGGGGGGGGTAIPTTITCADNDGDGWNTTIGGNCGAQADCDDDPSDDTIQYNPDPNVDIDSDGNYAEHINPGVAEIPYNAIDEDCDGSDLKC